MIPTMLSCLSGYALMHMLPVTHMFFGGKICLPLPLALPAEPLYIVSSTFQVEHIRESTEAER